MELIGKTVSFIILVLCTSLIGGIILYFCYPAITHLFPNAVANGIITAKLEFWDAAFISWISNVLFGYGSSSKS